MTSEDIVRATGDGGFEIVRISVSPDGFVSEQFVSEYGNEVDEYGS